MFFVENVNKNDTQSVGNLNDIFTNLADFHRFSDYV